MSVVRLGAVLVCLLPASLWAGGQQASPAEQQLDGVIAEYWEYALREDPLQATAVGIETFNDRLPRVTRADQLRRLEAERSFLRRLHDVDVATLSVAGRVNAEVFEWVLQDSVGAYELNLSRIPFNTFSGFFMDVLTAGNGVAMDSVEDYEAYIRRLRDVPRYFAENLDNMRAGMASDFVLPQVVIDGVLPTLEAQVKADPRESGLYAPFVDMSARVGPAEQTRLRHSAEAAISEAVMPAFESLVRFLRNEYVASETLGAEQLQDGEAYYAFNIRRYTTLPAATADAIHRRGLDEVRRIRGEMQTLIDEIGFDGDLEAFFAFLRSDPQFYATSREQLLKEAAYIAKRIDYVMPGFFGRLPRQSYGIVPVPDEVAPNYTTGAYHGAPPGGSHGGAYWLNTYALDQRPLYELAALTLHEAVPGHHHQNALALELEEVPAFRRNLYFSAFGEGWALYTEKLGVEMGIYRTPYEHFGRLSYEMWRACRLVIDTGLHSKGWTREQAMAFFRDNTSLSEGNIRAEVDRYISWPGQALAYKLGELKIHELRAKASRVLGERFDLREFHDVVLGNGAVPLALLENNVERWIDARLDQDD